MSLVVLTGLAPAAGTLDQWHPDTARIRFLAENDAPRAYREAQRLEADLPTSAPPGERARKIELVQHHQPQSRQRQLDELTNANQRQAAELREHALQRRWLGTLLGACLVALASTVYCLVRLRRAHRRLQAADTQRRLTDFALDHVHEAAYLTDAEGRIVYVNQEACRALGYDREELLTMTLLDIDPDARSTDIARINAELDASGALTFERYHQTRDGRNFPVEIFSTAFDYQGKPVSFSLARDITARRNAEAAWRARAELEQRLSAVAANVPGFIFTTRVDTAGHTSFPFASAGVEDLFGLSPADIRKDAAVLRARYHPHDLRRLLDLMKETERTLEPFRIDIRIINRDKRESWLEIRSTPHRQPDGATEWHGIMLDVTARKQAELDLQASRAQLRGLAAHIEETREAERKRIAREVHDELGPVLTGLQLNVAVLADRYPGDSEQLRKLLQDSAALTEQALAVARNVAATLRPAALDMGIATALNWLAGSFASNTGIRCDVHIEIPTIPLDESHAVALFRIVQESLTNIIRHAKAGKVAIVLTRVASDYVLKVRDNGVGFDVRSPKARSFGLVGIHERALLLGGTVSIDSRPGNGTEVAVRAPFPV